MGMDPNQITAFLDTISIAEENIGWILSYKDQQGYRNQLKNLHWKHMMAVTEYRLERYYNIFKVKTSFKERRIIFIFIYLFCI